MATQSSILAWRIPWTEEPGRLQLKQLQRVGWDQGTFTTTCALGERPYSAQYSGLENPMDGGAWWATVRGVAKSRRRLSHFTFTFCEKGL